MLEENDEQIRGYCVHNPSNILQRVWKMFTDSLLYAAWDVLFWVFFGTTNEQKRFPFICNNHKTLSHLELNLKRLRNVLEQRCIQ